MINKKGAISSIIIATILFVLFVVVLGTMTVSFSDKYSVELPAEYNETFENLDQLTLLGNITTGLDPTGIDQPQGILASIEAKFESAWNKITFVPRVLNVIKSIFTDTISLLGINPIFATVGLMILTVVIMIAILSIFLKTNKL